MASVSSRSQSARSLTIDDSFHREQQQRRWGNRRSRSRSSSRKLVRSNSVSSDYARAAGTMPPSTSSSAPKQRGKGKRMLRSVVGFLSRTKSGKGKPGSFTMTEPASPASASSLSRTNSDSSAHGVGRKNGSGRIGAGGPAGASKPRVSFDAVVQTVYIEQMKAEEVRNTFYCRTEYAAFKEAYRTHRDTTTGWCRGNDVLPCNCDACRDDLVEGIRGHHGHHIYSSARSTASAALSPDDDDDNYDSAFEAPPPPPSPHALAHKPESVCGKGEEEEGLEYSEPSSPYAYGHKGTAAKGGKGEGAEAQGHNAPPSPVGAVFQDAQEDSSSGSSCSQSSSSSGSSACSRGSRSSRSSSRATARKCPSTSTYSSTRRHSAAHQRRGTWGVGSVPIASPVGRAHKRGGSLDDWGVSSSVQQAVKYHGEGYAYKTLRLQGFSDLYIRTHFLPEG